MQHKSQEIHETEIKLQQNRQESLLEYFMLDNFSLLNRTNNKNINRKINEERRERKTKAFAANSRNSYNILAGFYMLTVIKRIETKR